MIFGVRNPINNMKTETSDNKPDGFCLSRHRVATVVDAESQAGERFRILKRKQ